MNKMNATPARNQFIKQILSQKGNGTKLSLLQLPAETEFKM